MVLLGRDNRKQSKRIFNNFLVCYLNFLESFYDAQQDKTV